MHTNKSAALSNTLSNLLPGSTAGQQRNAGMGTESGASFASLYKSSREQTPAAPPKPAAASPAPAATPTAAAQSAAAPKPVLPKPGSTRQAAPAAEASQAKGSDADTDVAAAPTERKTPASAKHTAVRQGPDTKVAEAEQHATTDAADPAMQALCTEPVSLDDDADDDKAGAGSEDNKAGAASAAGAAPAAAAMPVPPAEQLAAQLLAATRQAEPGQTPEAGAAAEDGDLARGEHRIGNGHKRPGEPELAGAGTAIAAAGSDKTAALPAGMSPLAHPDLAAAQAASTDAPGTPSKPADAEGHGTLSFQQVLSQAQGNPAPGPGGAAADTRMLPIRQELHSPGFAPAMGAQLSLLASEGVQSAQLLLNPAEMGPVAVQIVLDGQQAQISFHSDQAETRAVLERSLPDLAAALRENGLTLSGGGVFQQDAGTRQQQQADAATQARGQARGSPNGGTGEHEPLPAAPRRTAVARGVLDTYA